VLDTILVLLHPISPFLTEELWAETAPDAGRPGLLISSCWPHLRGEWLDPAADREIGLVIAAVSEGRSLRAELNVPPAARPDLIIVGARPEERLMLEANGAMIAHTLRSGEMTFASVPPPGAVPFVAAGVSLALSVGSLIDLAGERERLAKDIAARGADIDKTARKLANPDFVSRAPEEVVEENRERLADAEAARARLAAMLERLSVLA
jgi:valyl-tRNA synthetase